MMRHTIARWLDSDRIPTIAACISLALGLFFTFVWAPHPWGWQGIDAYHELARALARGEMFPTTDVPWGYAYYATAFYTLFGERLWAPLLGQVIANAFVPILLYRLVRPIADHRVAALSSLIVGIFSFNTIYASTEASDAICTVLFMLGLVTFSKGWRLASLSSFVISGLLFGLVPQFRPNLVLLPGVMAAVFVLASRFSARAIGHALVFCAMVLALQLPWIVRNYQLTGLFLPTSTHGGIQLWYGTLQVGPFLESRAHNPRFHFASPAFNYTSLIQRPIIVTSARRTCSDDQSISTELVYWTDRDPQRRHIAARPALVHERSDIAFEVPPQPDPTVVYYYFEQARPATAAPGAAFALPLEGAVNPYVYFVSGDHLGDIDARGDVLDVFDLVRLLRHIGWQEALPNPAQLDLNQDGATNEADVLRFVELIAPESLRRASGAPLGRVETSTDAVTLRLVDGSWLAVPRDFQGRQTDLNLSLDGEMAPALVSRSRTFTSIAYPPRPTQPGECVPAGDVAVNAPFNFIEPHMMQRFMALAMDNISRDPAAFIQASLYRMVRLFVVRGTDDLATAQQFRWSGVVYGVGTALSVAYLAVFLAGVFVAYRRRSALLLLLVPIVYVPATICFVLTNMRYSVTVQPLMFVFVAVAMVAALKAQPAGGTNAPSASASRDSG
jgi:hypothetical protein